METISMSRGERRRLEAFARVRRGEITLVKASELLGLSYRQAKRSFARYREEGDVGLVHRLRGRPSNRQVDARRKRRVLWSVEAESSKQRSALSEPIMPQCPSDRMPLSRIN